MIADYGLILDGLIVVLLCATVVYAATLNRRIGQLRDNRVELALAARAMTDAAAKADAGIKGLKQTAGGVGAAIQTDIEKARALRDELAFLVEAGEAMAGRLETAASDVGRAAKENRRPVVENRPPTSVNRPPSGNRQRSEVDPKSVRGSDDGGDGRAKRDLMKAIENLR